MIGSAIAPNEQRRMTIPCQFNDVDGEQQPRCHALSQSESLFSGRRARANHTTSPANGHSKPTGRRSSRMADRSLGARQIMTTKFTAPLLAAALLLTTAPAFAADLIAAPADPAKPAPAATNGTTIGLELSPEFFADPANAKYGQLNDVYFKGTVTQTVAPGWSISSSLQTVDKTSNSPATWQFLVDGNVAYKAKLNNNFSVTLTGGGGYTWGNTGYTGGVAVPAGVDPFFYYYGQVALDDKIDANWTWNVVNVRLRQAVGVQWFTPKIQTGVTYNIDSSNAVYANIGYAWKDNGSGLKPDKFNVAVGYKYSF